MSKADPLDPIVERIAEAVIRKVDEREKIDLIADAVLQRMHARDVDEAASPPEPRSSTRASQSRVRTPSRRKRR